MECWLIFWLKKMDKAYFSQSLETEHWLIRPVLSSDFASLYAVGKNPVIWAQHSEKNRGDFEEFQRFFDQGMEQGWGFYVVVSQKTQEIVGSTRFYEFNPQNRSIAIGYTFFDPSLWGSGVNSAVKKAQLDHAFQQVEQVFFYVYDQNFRSQKAVAKLGAQPIGVRGDRVIFGLTRAQWSPFLP
jgi:RimJ/RimL family protein N-acetyltransferase